MTILSKLNLKLAIFCLVLVSLQTALLSSVDLINFNLPLAFIFVSASLLPLYESLIVASLLCVISSVLVYDMTIFWTYPLLAFVATKLNPSQIANKLIVCVVFNIIFTPLFELIYAQGHFNLAQNLKAILTNLSTSIVLFFIVKLSFKTKSW